MAMYPCPKCNTPMISQPITRPPFAAAASGEWRFRRCPTDGCGYEEYACLADGREERYSHAGRRLDG